MKKFAYFSLFAVTLLFSGCISSAEDEANEQTVTYNYKYLTYCDGPAGLSTDDCYDVGTNTFITIIGDYSNGRKVKVKANFGPNGIITDEYTSYGVKADGYLELSNSHDRMQIYSDFAYVIGSNYYWSFSNYKDLYKRK